MSDLDPKQLADLEAMESKEEHLDEWQDLCRAVIVRAILDYATYGYKSDSFKNKKIHDDAKYWLFADNGVVLYAEMAALSVSFIRQTARKLREQVKTGEYKIQRDLKDFTTNGQLSLLDLWSDDLHG